MGIGGTRGVIRMREEQKMLVKNWGAQRGREREACIVRGVTMLGLRPIDQSVD